MTKSHRIHYYILAAIITMIFTACQERESNNINFESKVIQLSHETAQKMATEIRKEVTLEVHEDFEVSLWASDSLLADPIAISIDPNGRIYYTSASRKANSEFDIRGHRNWMTASISFETVEDRRKFLRETFSTENEEGKEFLKDLNNDGTLNWKDLAVQKEQVWLLDDTDSDGIADRAQLYLEDFNEEITDVANGILHFEDDVYAAAGPDLWRTTNTNEDGKADQKFSLSHGYAVHIGFSEHGMSGVTVGPAGRIWWGIGDIGMNVVDQTGKRWKYPNQGVVVRSDPDGSNFEVFSAGLRNTHEFVFDNYGNLITVDNDGDHSGERERLVYLVDGSDSGWRINWQFGKYTDPDNNTYKVWMDEGMSIPRWDGQAAYFIPPIANYVNGPTGMVYNPGTALSPEWYEHFFIAEFQGSSANSPIHAFKLRSSGASFEMDTTLIAVKGALPTGIDFGPDGALYFGDWIEGWGTKDYGRLWKMDVRDQANSAIRLETKLLIESDFSQKTLIDLDALLAHQDKRIRQKSQFELVKREDAGYDILTKAVAPKNKQLKRIHAIWGIAQVARRDVEKAEVLVDYLDDEDDEIVAQAARWIGDVRYSEVGEALVPLLKSESPRVRFFAAEALGRIAHEAATDEIIKMLDKNDDEDVYLTHAGSLALARIGNAELLIALKNSDSNALKTAAVVALRRMNHAGVAEFLDDPNEYIVAEAARAINDDYSIEEALPALANLIKTTSFNNEGILRRAINANMRLGKSENLQNLIDFVNDPDISDVMLEEGISALSTWHKPSVLDRVDGRYRGEVARSKKAVMDKFSPVLETMLNSGKGRIQNAAIAAVGKLGATELTGDLLRIFSSSTRSRTKRTALRSLAQMNYDGLADVLRIALEAKAYTVRSEALALITESDIPKNQAASLFGKVLEKQNTSIIETQIALASLGEIQTDASAAILDMQFDKFKLGALKEEAHLELIDAIEKQDNEQLLERLEEYFNSISNNPLAKYIAVLKGGNARNGQNVFLYHLAAKCTLCHSVYESGDRAGPRLAGVGNRLTDMEILQSLVMPSAQLSPGYAVVSLKLEDDEVVAGMVKNENDETMTIQKGNKEQVVVTKSNIVERFDIPSSMPDMSTILSKTEIRDLVAYLKGLKA